MLFFLTWFSFSQGPFNVDIWLKSPKHLNWKLVHEGLFAIIKNIWAWFSLELCLDWTNDIENCYCSLNFRKSHFIDSELFEKELGALEEETLK